MSNKEINTLVQNISGILSQEFDKSNIKINNNNKYQCICCGEYEMILSSETNTCKCSSCNINLNTISFLMKIYNYEFPQVLLYLNDNYNTKIPIYTKNIRREYTDYEKRSFVKKKNKQYKLDLYKECLVRKLEDEKINLVNSDVNNAEDKLKNIDMKLNDINNLDLNSVEDDVLDNFILEYIENKNKELDDKWKEWLEQYNKSYDDIFFKNINDKEKDQLIQELKKMYDDKYHKYTDEKNSIYKLTFKITALNDSTKEFLECKRGLLEKTKNYKLNKSTKTEKEKIEESYSKDKFFLENLKFDESINYTKFNSSEVYEIDNYIDEKNYIKNLFNYKTSLLIAPTSSGKTFAIINYLKTIEKQLEAKNIKVCFVVPNTIQVQQISCGEYEIPGAWEGKNENDVFRKNTISCYTWNKFSLIKEDISSTIVFLDEVHQIFTDIYRKNAIDKMLLNLNRCKKRIDITATPNKLDFSIYDFILEYHQRNKIKYNVKNYNNINDNEIEEIILTALKNNKKIALLRDDINELNLLVNKIKSKNKNTNATIITGENKKNNPAFNSIIEKGTLEYTTEENQKFNINLLCNTSCMMAGLNIYDKDISDIIIIGFKDICQIKQYSARFRSLKEVNLHIFNNYPNTISKTYNLENFCKNQISMADKTATNYNLIRLSDFSSFKTYGDEFNLFSGEIRVVYGNYVADIVKIRNKIYTNYYDKSDIVSHTLLLKEYFECVDIIELDKFTDPDVKKYKRDIKNNANCLLKQLEEFKDTVVGRIEMYQLKKQLIKSNKKIDNDLVEAHLDADVYSYYTKNYSYNICDLIESIDENEISTIELSSQAKKFLLEYTKLVAKKGYPTNFAWILTKLSNSQRSRFDMSIEAIKFNIYTEALKKEGLLDNLSIEGSEQLRIINFIYNNVCVNTVYTKRDFNDQFEELNKKFEKRISYKQYRNYISCLFLTETIGKVTIDNKRYEQIMIKDYVSFKNLKEVHKLSDLTENDIDFIKNLTIKSVESIIEN